MALVLIKGAWCSSSLGPLGGALVLDCGCVEKSSDWNTNAD